VNFRRNQIIDRSRNLWTCKLSLNPFCKCSRRVRGYYLHNYN